MHQKFKSFPIMLFKRGEVEYIKPKFIEINNLAVKLYEDKVEDWDAVSQDLIVQGYFKEDVTLVIDDLIKQQKQRAISKSYLWLFVGIIIFAGGMAFATIFQCWLNSYVQRVILNGGIIIVYGIYKREQAQR